MVTGLSRTFRLPPFIVGLVFGIGRLVFLEFPLFTGKGIILQKLFFIGPIFQEFFLPRLCGRNKLYLSTLIIMLIHFLLLSSRHQGNNGTETKCEQQTDNQRVQHMLFHIPLLALNDAAPSVTNYVPAFNLYKLNEYNKLKHQGDASPLISRSFKYVILTVYVL
jgi:hypothetical protein